MAADPFNKPKTGPMPPIDLSEEELEREAKALRDRLDEVTARLQHAIGQPAPTTDVPRTSAGAFLPRRVLIVEDDAEARAMLMGLIARLGHDVRAVANGLDALLTLQSLHPDVVMVDLSMPGLDGYTVARRIKAALGTEAPVLVAYTGFTGTAIRSAALASGFDHHVMKPIAIDALMRLLQPHPHLQT